MSQSFRAVVLGAEEDLVEEAAGVLRSQSFGEEVSGHTALIDEAVGIFPVLLPFRHKVIAGNSSFRDFFSIIRV